MSTLPEAKPAAAPKPARQAAAKKPAAAKKTVAAKLEKLARPVKAPAAAPVPAAATSAPKAPRTKEKLVRDSFTMPRAEFAVIHELKERALGFKRATKKSELLRAGLQVLAALDDTTLKTVLDMLPALKAGRPRKGS
jgi:hypothetical protein